MDKGSGGEGGFPPSEPEDALYYDETYDSDYDRLELDVGSSGFSSSQTLFGQSFRSSPLGDVGSDFLCLAPSPSGSFPFSSLLSFIDLSF